VVLTFASLISTCLIRALKFSQAEAVSSSDLFSLFETTSGFFLRSSRGYDVKKKTPFFCFVFCLICFYQVPAIYLGKYSSLSEVWCLCVITY